METAVAIVITMGLKYVEASPTRNRILHYYADTATTWNDANVQCRDAGMTMLTVDTQDVITAMAVLSEKGRELESLDDFWIGLHDYSGVNGVNDYVWGTCLPLGSYAPWRSNDDPDNRRCIRGKDDLQPDNNWETRFCSKTDGKIICEEYTGHCSYNLNADMVPDLSQSSITELREYNVSEIQCQTICHSHSVLPECWGYHFNADDFICTLYLGNSFTELKNSLLSQTGNDTHLKFCFVAIRNDTELPDPQYDNEADDAPHTGCSSPATAATTVMGTTVMFLDTTKPTTEETTSGQTTITTRQMEATTPIETTKTTGRITTPDQSTTTADQNEPTTTPVETTMRTTPDETTTGRGSSYQETSTTSVVESTAASAGTTTKTTSVTTPGETTTYTVESATSIDTTLNLETTIKTTNEVDFSTGNHLTTETESTTDTTVWSYLGKTSAVQISPGPVECVCDCQSQSDLTEVEKRQFIDDIITNLTLDKNQISTIRRKYFSAHDPRPSATVVGAVGVTILSLTFLGLFLFDLGALYRDITYLWRRLRARDI